MSSFWRRSKGYRISVRYHVMKPQNNLSVLQLLGGELCDDPKCLQHIHDDATPKTNSGVLHLDFGGNIARTMNAASLIYFHVLKCSLKWTQ